MLPLVDVKQSSYAGRDDHELRPLGLVSKVLGLQACNHPTRQHLCLFTVGSDSRWSPQPTLGTNHAKSDVQ